jgi:hypothetical protein
VLREAVLGLLSDEFDALPFLSPYTPYPLGSGGGAKSAGLLLFLPMLLLRERSETIDRLFFSFEDLVEIAVIGRSGSSYGSSSGTGGMGICAYAIAGGLLGGRKSYVV